MRLTEDGRLGIGTAGLTVALHGDGPARVASCMVAPAPSASASGAGAFVHVSNATGGAVPAFPDGTGGRCAPDRAVIACGER